MPSKARWRDITLKSTLKRVGVRSSSQFRAGLTRCHRERRRHTFAPDDPIGPLVAPHGNTWTVLQQILQVRVWTQAIGIGPSSATAITMRFGHTGSMRPLGHLVIDLGEDGFKKATAAWIFVAAETLYGLSAILPPDSKE